MSSDSPEGDPPAAAVTQKDIASSYDITANSYSLFPLPSSSSEFVSYRIGFPSTQHIKQSFALYRSCVTTAFSPLEADDGGDLRYEMMHYGHVAGFRDFRSELARFLNREYGYEDRVDGSSAEGNLQVVPEELFACAGISGGLSLVLSLWTSSGDLVFAEDPTYFLAKSIFEDFKLTVEQIAMEDDGLNIDIIEQRLESGVVPKLLYTIPTAHNPTGRTMPNWKRKKLVALAEKYQFVIVADEAYQLLTFTTTPADDTEHLQNGDAAHHHHQQQQQQQKDGGEMPTPMALVDPSSERVFGVNSFSKIFAPGVRLGWIHARYSQLDRLYRCGQIFSGGGVSPVVCGAMHVAIRDGHLKALLDWTKSDLQMRATRMVQLLQKELPEGCHVEIPLGGYFILCHLPIGSDAARLEDLCQEKYKLDILPGSSFSATMAHCFRLAFSFYQTEDYDRASSDLCTAIREFLHL